MGRLPGELATADAAAVIAGLLDAAPVAMLIAGSDGEVLAANERAGEIFGIETQALPGRPLTELLGGVTFETGGAGELLEANGNGAPGAGSGEANGCRAVARGPEGIEVPV